MPTPKDSYLRREAGALLLGALVLVVNAVLCHRLFHIEFSSHMDSIESSYMSISRWAMSNWSDLSWFPLWFNGMPFHRVYQPGLHLTVAALATAVGWTPQHAYHFLTALAYSMGAVSLFWFCYKTMGNRWQALASGLLYSLVSPICFLVPNVRADSGGWLTPRRYQVLVHYGEGPHLTAAAMIPLVLLVLHYAVALRRRWAIALAPFALAAVVLTNWPGSMGLSMAVLAYCISRIDSFRFSQWLILGATGAVGYLICSPWMPPTIVSSVFRNAHQSDDTTFGSQQLAPLLLIIAALAAMHFVFSRKAVVPWVRFFGYFVVVSGAVSVGREWFGWRLLPQPNRFQVEFEMAFACMLGYLVVWWLARIPKPLQRIGVCVLLLLAAAQTVVYAKHIQRQTGSVRIESTIEYRMAKWFAANLGRQRVFAPGNVSLWMNMFTDVPQVAGCCDQGIPSQSYRHAVYAIYTGQNAGAKDAAISQLWLRAYGANAVGVTGPGSSECFKPFWNPRKFDGVLPELWRDGDNVVYRVPRKSVDPVRVIPKTSIVSRPPENGLDTGQVQPFVAALEDPAIPAPVLRWVNGHEIQIDGETRLGDVVHVQISHDPGWRAAQDGAAVRIGADALGMMWVEPLRSGPVHLRLVYDGGAERTLARFLLVAGLLMVPVLAWFGGAAFGARLSRSAEQMQRSW